MHGGENDVFDPEAAVEYPGDRRQAVRGAGGHGNDLMLFGVIALFVHPQDDGSIRIIGGSRKDDPLGTRLQMPRCFGTAPECAAALDDDVRA